jgi:hypothetical protein
MTCYLNLDYSYPEYLQGQVQVLRCQLSSEAAMR